VKNSECQQGDLIFDPLRNAQPVKCGQRVSDVIGRSRAAAFSTDCMVIVASYMIQKLYLVYRQKNSGPKVVRREHPNILIPRNYL